MILKNSIKNLVRSGGKSTLFFLLILIITIVQCLGIGIWLSIDNFMEECNENYKTIGLLEYMGQEYPDDNIYDPGMDAALDDFDFTLFEGNENVLLWDRGERALGYIEGLQRKDIYAPLRSNSVVIINQINEYKRNAVKSAVIKETLYSGIDYTGRAVLIEDFGYELEEGHTYLVHGVLGYGTTSYRYFTPTLFSLETAEKAEYKNFDDYMILDITEMNENTAEKREVFEMMARTYNVINNSVSVHSTNDLESNLHFHQQLLYISEGRSFTDSEYTDGDRVCVITEFIANKLDLSIGDKITLSIAIAKDTPVYESYWDGTGFSHEDEYEVVGICNTISEHASNVYIPKNSNINYSLNQVGYTIGTIVLDNEKADSFYHEVEKQLPNRVRLTIYDQGYSAVVEPFKKILRIAVIISLTSIFAGIAVITLFGYMFIYRQREVSDIMIKLGSGKWKTGRYFLYGSGIIAITASWLGAAAGYFLSNEVVGFIINSLGSYGVTDRRYSISNLSILKTLEWTGKVDLRVFIIIGAAVFAAAVCSCLVFTFFTFRNRNKKRKRVRKLREKKRYLNYAGGPLKYTFISIIRSGPRSIITPIAAIAMVLLISQLTSTAQRYERQFEDFYDNTVIDGQLMDINGRYYNNLVLDAYQLHDLVESGFISNLSVTKSRPFHYLGKVMSDEGFTYIEPFELPDGFSGETVLDRIKRGPKVIFSNSLSRSPEFYYSSLVKTEFLDGYDESVLGIDLAAGGIPFGIVSTDFMLANGVQLGDTIRVYIVDKKHYELDIYVMGSYEKEGAKDNIYCQLGAYFNPSALVLPSDWEREQFYKYSFESASFTVSETSKLNEFKEFMASYGFSAVNNISTYRTFPVLDDKVFIGTVESFNQRLRQTDVLYPFIYGLTGIMGFVLSFIMVYSRKREIAFMRGLGAVKSRIFVSFFMEQLILCLSGSGIGIALWIISAAGYNMLQFILTAGFVILYCAGSAAAFLFINRTGILAMLGDEE